MITIDAIGGMFGRVSWRYDTFADVLYLRLLADEETETYADMANGSDMLLRDQATDRPVGLTVIGWWKRFGQGLGGEGQPLRGGGVLSLSLWVRSVAAAGILALPTAKDNTGQRPEPRQGAIRHRSGPPVAGRPLLSILPTDSTRPADCTHGENPEPARRKVSESTPTNAPLGLRKLSIRLRIG